MLENLPGVHASDITRLQTGPTRLSRMTGPFTRMIASCIIPATSCLALSMNLGSSFRMVLILLPTNTTLPVAVMPTRQRTATGASALVGCDINVTFDIGLVPARKLSHDFLAALDFAEVDGFLSSFESATVNSEQMKSGR
jgi:hypothetical protein